MGDRIKSCRIRLSYTQEKLAELSGLSKGTVANVENGSSIQLENLLRILRELDELNSLEVLLPSSGRTPMELISSDTAKKRQRVRARHETVENSNCWKWGEDE